MPRQAPKPKFKPSGLATIRGGIINTQQPPDPIFRSPSEHAAIVETQRAQFAILDASQGRTPVARPPVVRPPVDRLPAVKPEPVSPELVDSTSAPAPAPAPAQAQAPAHPAPAHPPSSSPMSCLTRTPSLTPEAAERLADVASQSVDAAAGEIATEAECAPRMHIQARLAHTKANLTRIYQTKDKTLPPERRDRESLLMGPFVRLMARVYTASLEDVRVQKHLRDKVMTPAHFAEMMIWHGRAVRERERKAADAAAGAAPTTGLNSSGPKPADKGKGKAPARAVPVKRKGRKK